MEIEWDNNKAASNLIKHKIDFEDAKNIFLDPNRLEREDKRDYDETRIQVIGIVNQVVLWLFGLCYAMDGSYKGWNPYIERHLAIFVNCFFLERTNQSYQVTKNQFYLLSIPKETADIVLSSHAKLITCPIELKPLRGNDRHV
ncbi:MAG: BrnT family toxin [Microcystis sp. M_OC_Ca_00000000_C217Col]|uniref:BrnT family toxin n=1 Tax=Microcystis sp. M_OC_Ca_00000000_C217Col TaxID=2486213 RepID=UPI001197D3B5|nr:BrnT family toxin [Microcystis sp. M_OC_Ca_00000000_C217Col]TRT92906.1 MAG: BrnT family toxin [Microcystis sp. M_OC_Ca_00000000_C217Col]